MATTTKGAGKGDEKDPAKDAPAPAAVPAATGETDEQKAAREAEEERQAAARDAVNPAGDGPETAAEKVAEAADPVAVAASDPYPAYDVASLEELRGLADARGVFINRDVEKAHRVDRLRKADRNPETAPAGGVGAAPEYDLMPLDQLRDLCSDRGVTMDPEFERGQLVTELRAADTHTG